MANRKVFYVQLHGPVYVPGLGNITQQELGPKAYNSTKFKGLSMEHAGTHIEVFTETVSFGIPLANVQTFAFEPTADKAVIVSKPK